MSIDKWGVTAKDSNVSTIALAVKCLICGESIPTGSLRETVKICDKCKAAVMKVREEMEGAE